MTAWSRIAANARLKRTQPCDHDGPRGATSQVAGAAAHLLERGAPLQLAKPFGFVPGQGRPRPSCLLYTSDAADE